MITNMERYKQFVDYDGIGYGRCRLSDLDGWMEIGDSTFVFIEVKFNSKELPNGQRIALERIANVIAETGRQAIVIVVEHHEKDKSKDVILADCNVRRYYYNGTWVSPSDPETVKSLIDRYIPWGLSNRRKPIKLMPFFKQVLAVNMAMQKTK